MCIKNTITPLLICSLLISCGGKKDETPEKVINLEVSGSKSAVLSIGDLASRLNTRPSAAMGLYTSMYLSQGVFFQTLSALQGINAQLQLLRGRTITGSDETYILLQEFGSVLQLDVFDILNRSDNRVEALDRYIDTLENITILAERKEQELDGQVDELKDKRKEQRDEERDIERAIKKALDAEDFGTAGSRQQSLTEAKTRLAETEAFLESTEDIQERYQNMLALAKERGFAIQKNRQVLIAGLKVIEVPGIEALQILEEGARRRRSSDGGDLFGGVE